MLVKYTCRFTRILRLAASEAVIFSIQLLFLNRSICCYCFKIVILVLSRNTNKDVLSLNKKPSFVVSGVSLDDNDSSS